MYEPKPIDTSSVTLPDSLVEVREVIAEHVHDLWAQERIKNGWKYGTQRDDQKKETPCLVPYSELPESEKEYDRTTAEGTLKAILSLGYDIVKVK